MPFVRWRLPTRYAVLVALLGAIVSVAQVSAQNVVLEPRSLVVNPRPAFDLTVFVDRDPSGEAAPSYAVGLPIVVSARTSAEAYLYLFSISAGGDVVQIMPNRLADGRDNLVRSGATAQFPPRNARYEFVVDPPTGMAKVFALATKRPIDTGAVVRYEGERDFMAVSRAGVDGFARALSSLVGALPPDEWTTSAALYYVGGAPARGAYGTLAVTSVPSGAEVRVNGAFAGYTPLRRGELPGAVRVEIRHDGHEVHQESVDVVADRVVTVSAQLPLVPTAQQGEVRFASEPSGASVLLDGQQLGFTPLSISSFDPGEYRVTFRLDGYEDLVTSFVVRAGDETVVHERFESIAPAIGGIRISNGVDGARVYLAGRLAGVIVDGGRLLIDDVEPGEHEVVVTALGYRTEVVQVHVVAGAPVDIELGPQRY